MDPVGSLTKIVVEYQHALHGWTAWSWFPTGASGEGARPIEAKTKADGTYRLTYAQTIPPNGTIRLRVLGKRGAHDPTAVSKSWYVTPPVGC